MSEIEKKEKKTPKTSITKSSKGKTNFQSTNEALVALYDKTISLLEEGIKKGATNSPLGLISFMAYIDLLHGGAYTVPITQRPFFINNKDSSPYWAPDLINQDAPQGLGGWLASILGGINAGPLVQEVFEDSSCPHVFPKLLSDEMYAVLKAVFAWFTSTDLLKEAGTGVQTFVEAGKTVVETTTKASESAVGTTKELMPLLGLLAGA
jgi:hypothetical protein